MWRLSGKKLGTDGVVECKRGGRAVVSGGCAAVRGGTGVFQRFLSDEMQACDLQGSSLTALISADPTLFKFFVSLNLVSYAFPTSSSNIVLFVVFKPSLRLFHVYME